MLEYTVRPGDTLAKLATYYGVSEEYILSANPILKQQLLPPGTRIRIPISRELEQFRRQIRPR
jgi:LysM repeat protein